MQPQRNRECVDAIATHTPFRNHRGSFRAGPPVPAHAALAEFNEFKGLYNDLADRFGDRMYVVYSYDTPIAWRTPTGGWFMPLVRYSMTTDRHQHYTRLGMYRADDERRSA